MSHKLDFGKAWFGIPCSQEYWETVSPIFDRLKAGKANGELSYHAIDDQGIGYEITMEYIESNEANPEEVGLNYVSIYKTDSDDDELVELGRTWR